MFAKRLTNARKAAGLSLREVGTQVGLSHAAIKKYEDGKVLPSSDVLLKLARTLKVRSEYFFRPDTIDLTGLEYRKKCSLPKKRLAAITQEVVDQIERRLELESFFPTTPVKPFVQSQSLVAEFSTFDSIEFAAEALRKEWNLGLNPIPDITDLLESHGIRVFLVDTNSDAKFDGLAATANGMPVIVVGGNWPGDRQRLTLAHELGHLMLRGRLQTTLDEEKACHRFAGAFLFPRCSVLQELGTRRTSIEPKELALLKEEFGLSMSATLYRAKDLGIISQEYHKRTMIKFRMLGWHRVEPGPPYPSEKTHVFEQHIFHALGEGYIGEAKAAELLGMPLINFRRFRALEGIHAIPHQ